MNLPKGKTMTNGLPDIFLQNGHTVSSIVVALNGMMPGNYGDMITGADTFVHVTRQANGAFNAVFMPSRKLFHSGNTLRVAQFVADRIEL